MWKCNFLINSIKEGIVNYKREFILSSANLAWTNSIKEGIIKYYSLKFLQMKFVLVTLTVAKS
jgi:hypothetical protein